MHSAASHMRFWTIAAAVLFLGAVPVVYAQEGITSAYRQFKDVPKTFIQVVVPMVVEVPFDRDFLESYEFAVQDTVTNRFEPSYFVQTNKSATFTAGGKEAAAKPPAP